jgi:hypothetical protein
MGQIRSDWMCVNGGSGRRRGLADALNGFPPPARWQFRCPTVPRAILQGFLHFRGVPRGCFGTGANSGLGSCLQGLGRWDGRAFQPGGKGEWKMKNGEARPGRLRGGLSRDSVTNPCLQGFMHFERRDIRGNVTLWKVDSGLCLQRLSRCHGLNSMGEMRI